MSTGSLHGALAVLALAIASGCATFVDGVAAVSGKGGTIARQDAVPDLAAAARILAPHHPAPEWESPFLAETADMLHSLGDHRTLVGLLEIDAWLARPKHGPLVLYDLRSGAEVWRAPRKSMPRGTWSLIAAGSQLVLLGSDPDERVLQVVDAATGATCWTKKLAPTCEVQESSAAGVLILSTREGDELELEAIEVKSGLRAWRRALPNPRSVPSRLAAAGEHLLSIGQDVVSLEPDDGAVRWSMPSPVGSEADVLFELVGKSLLLWHAGGVLLVDVESGSSTFHWEAPADAVIESVSMQRDKILALTRHSHKSNGHDLRAIDVASGEPLFSCEAGGWIVSALAHEAGRIVFTTDREVVAKDSTTGRDLVRVSLPVGLLGEAVAVPSGTVMKRPDRIRVDGGRLYVSRPRLGLAAFDVATLEVLWCQRLTEAPLPAHSVEQRGNKLTLLLEGITAARAQASSPSPAVKAYRGPNQHLISAQRHHDSVRRSPNSSNFERELATKGLINAHKVSNAAESIMNSIDMLNAAFALASAIERFLVDEALEGLLQRSRVELEGARFTEEECYSGRWWHFPFRRGAARGVSIVDLETGGRCELVFGVGDDGIDALSADVLNCMLYEETGILVAICVGLQPDSYETHVKWSHRIPRPSIMGFSLDSLTFRPAAIPAGGLP